MNFPINIKAFDKEISTHLLTEILGIFIGLRYYSYQRRNNKDLISDINRLKIFAAVCLGALIGSRLVGVLENPIEFMNSQNKFVYIFSNKTIIGGLLGALIMVELVKKRIGVTVSSGDMMVYPIILALIIGRIGCFCEGLADGTIGKATSLFTGINFGDSVYRHPLPLYEITFLIVLWIMVFLVNKKYTLANGALFKLFLISYLIFRFLVEFLKDNAFTMLSLSTLQITCLFGLIYYYKILFNPKKLFIHA